MFERALSSDVLDVAGLHVHRGMLLRDAATIDHYLDAVLAFATSLVTDVGVDLRDLDVGGSLAIPTVASFSALDRRLSQTFLADPAAPNPAATMSIEAYVQKVASKTEEAFVARGLSVPTVILEPGRSLTGNAQILLTSVMTTKRGREGPPHAVLDGGINIAEPAQFEYHRAVCAARATDPQTETWRMVGPACTPGDVLFSAWPGPDLQAGDVIAIMDAGAYFVPFSTTFSFPRPGIVSIENGAVRALRRPETFDDLVVRDRSAFPSR